MKPSDNFSGKPGDKPGLWRQTPPAIFPPILGLLGLGLAWRQAGSVFGVPGAIGDIILAVATLLFILAAIAYLAKFFRRPSALLDDLQTPPGRAGISAGTMSAMLLGGVLAPVAICLGKVALFAGIGAHLIVATTVVLLLWNAPFAQRRINPVWHLTFVGIIVGAQAGMALELRQMSEIILFVTIALAITIWLGNLIGLLDNPVPPPLRPALVIHLAPASLLGIVAMQLGFVTLGMVFGLLALALAIFLLLRLRYLTAAGFSPLWGAFTFPMAAFAGLMLLLAQNSAGLFAGLFMVIAGLALAAASLVVPVIAYRVLKMWRGGQLAAKTKASAV